MYQKILAALSFVSVAMAFGACSSSGSGGTSSGAGDSGASCSTIVHDPQYPTEKCNNAADRCYMLAHEADVRAVGGDCAVNSCIQFIGTPYSTDAVNCEVQCLVPGLQTKTGGTISSACAECSAAVVACGATFCAAKCAGSPGSSNGPDSQGCTDCLCATHIGDAGGTGFSGNCLQDAFAQCAGFRPTNAQVGCPG